MNEVVPVDMKVLMNHIYEYQKGVRQMVLFTFNRRFEEWALRRLDRQGIDYLVQPPEPLLRAARMLGSHPPLCYEAAQPAHPRGGLHTRSHAGL